MGESFQESQTYFPDLSSERERNAHQTSSRIGKKMLQKEMETGKVLESRSVPWDEGRVRFKIK